jgi:hypothetical protein
MLEPDVLLCHVGVNDPVNTEGGEVDGGVRVLSAYQAYPWIHVSGVIGLEDGELQCGAASN